ncbi:hypothetical protein GGX14DRAFT_397905 [Mycena pura]|uniref:Uncharacterized protein n=1 Tax=Mycena pura TaxID=153505 RepID=A0AAD6V7P5_9AGAR|nr:hypothetical protein GGX14DRAFT_397905 [Mycena pura]
MCTSARARPSSVGHSDSPKPVDGSRPSAHKEGRYIRENADTYLEEAKAVASVRVRERNMNSAHLLDEQVPSAVGVMNINVLKNGFEVSNGIFYLEAPIHRETPVVGNLSIWKPGSSGFQ